MIIKTILLFILSLLLVVIQHTIIPGIFSVGIWKMFIPDLALVFIIVCSLCDKNYMRSLVFSLVLGIICGVFYSTNVVFTICEYLAASLLCNGFKRRIKVNFFTIIISVSVLCFLINIAMGLLLSQIGELFSYNNYNSIIAIAATVACIIWGALLFIPIKKLAE